MSQVATDNIVLAPGTDTAGRLTKRCARRYRCRRAGLQTDEPRPIKRQANYHERCRAGITDAGSMSPLERIDWISSVLL